MASPIRPLLALLILACSAAAFGGGPSRGISITGISRTGISAEEEEVRWRAGDRQAAAALIAALTSTAAALPALAEEAASDAAAAVADVATSVADAAASVADAATSAAAEFDPDLYGAAARAAAIGGVPTDAEIGDLPAPWTALVFAVAILGGVGLLTGSLGDVYFEEASLGMQSGAQAKRERERSRASYFKKK